MSEIALRPGNGHLTEDERDRAMLVLALNGSHAGRAQKQLEAEGLTITERQLQNYRHWPRYLEIREQKATEIERDLLTHYKDAGRLSVELQIEATADTLQSLKDGLIKPSETGKIAQQAAVASGIALDKAMLIEGRPTSIQAQTNIETDIAAMGRMMGFHVDSTATEIPAEPSEPTLLRESSAANPRDTTVS